MSKGIMAPNVENCKKMVPLNDEDASPVAVHRGRTIFPNLVPPVQAWVENEKSERVTGSRTNSPWDNWRFIGAKVENKTLLQAGLTLAVEDIKKYRNCPEIAKKVTTVKSKFQKRKEKLIGALKPPYFIITIIIIMVIVRLSVPHKLERWLEWPSSARWHEPWRLLSYGFIHANTTHLALNAVLTLVIGWRLEHEQGWARVAIVWVVGVAAGALGAGALQPKFSVVGASAAVYALLTAHLPNVCLRLGHIPLWWFRPLSAVMIGASELCWALLEVPEDGAKGHYDHVAWSAHVLGAAVGIPLGFLMFTGENITKRYIQICRLLSVLLLVVGVLLAIIHYAGWYKVDMYT